MIRALAKNAVSSSLGRGPVGSPGAVAPLLIERPQRQIYTQRLYKYRMNAPVATSPPLIFAALLGACVWGGGLVTIAIVVGVTREQLDRTAQVDFLRALGRRYLRVGAPALALALGPGAVLLGGRPWNLTSSATVVVGVALVVVTAAGVVQAQGMTRLRAEALDPPGDDHVLAQQIRRGSVRATVLRAAIGLLSVALLALVSVLAGDTSPSRPLRDRPSSSSRRRAGRERSVHARPGRAAPAR